MNLKQIIKNTIIQKGEPIGFDEFMNLALYYPSKGYYRCGLQKFGKGGDFITAPETSDLFGFCLARQCFEVLSGENDILEFGAGSGALAGQILFELGRLGKLPKTYYILELSIELQHRQQQTLRQILPELMDRIVWLSELPKRFSGVVIANEVLDAMPAKRLIKQNDYFVELGVNYQNNQFLWQPFNTPFSDDCLAVPKALEIGYTTEVNPTSMAWIDALGGVIEQGLILLIDYGMDKDEYFHPQRNEGTLRCYYQHQASDNPFQHIGKQDITTSVNFSDITRQAQISGFNIAGYCTQAMFLISLGINTYLSLEKDGHKRIDLAQQIKQLVLPSAMGESFKVLALTKNISAALSGFTEQDLTHKL